MKNYIKQNIVPIILLLISFVVCMYRANLSFCLSDEPFYIATASRFYKGDSIFFHEWFPTQLSSLLLVPLYALYVSIKGSTVGIILFFRILYVIFELVCSVSIYYLIRKHHGSFSAAIISLFSMWYVHLNIATLSYYTMTIQFYLLTMLILYNFYTESSKTAITDASCKEEKTASDSVFSNNKINKKTAWSLIVAGFLFALAVLCLPTLCIPYFLVVITGGLITYCGKLFKNVSIIRQISEKIQFFTVFIYTFIGISVPAAVFFIYLLTHVSIKNFISSIPYVLSDDEHITSAIYPLKKMYLSINESYGKTAYMAYCFIFLAFVIFIAMLFSKYAKQSAKKTGAINNFVVQIKPYFLLVDFILFFMYLVKSFNYTGYIFTALMLFTIPLFLVTEKKNYTLFFFTIVSGLIFSLTYSYSSNGMLYVLAMGHFIASTGGIILAFDFVNEIEWQKPVFKKIITGFVCFILVISVVRTAHLRIVNVYRDAEISRLNSKITEGPAKGLYTTSEHLMQYDSLMDTINEYCMKSSGDNYKNLLITKLLPLGYLVSDLNVAAPSVWRNPMNSSRLMEYYEFTGNKYPDVVFLLDSEVGSYESCGDIVADPVPNENDKEGLMYDYLDEHNFKRINVPFGVIYQRP